MPKGPEKGDTRSAAAVPGLPHSWLLQVPVLQGGPPVLLQDLKLDAAVDYKDSSTSLAEQLIRRARMALTFTLDNGWLDTGRGAVR
jgi:hypothetical protein